MRLRHRRFGLDLTFASAGEFPIRPANTRFAGFTLHFWRWSWSWKR